MTTPVLRIEDAVLPSERDAQLARDSSRRLAACIGRGETARLRVIDDDGEIEVPVAALRMLVDILTNMAEGNAITLVPVHAELTTQQAADFLNVSRPYLVRLVEQGALPFHKVGTHRRIRFADLLTYRQRLQDERRAALEDLTAQAEDLGLGY